jgi:hypothetical protein
MALISVSDWLDRSGQVDPPPGEPPALDSIRFAVTESKEASRIAASVRMRGLRQRLDQVFERTFWRIKRQLAGSR